MKQAIAAIALLALAGQALAELTAEQTKQAQALIVQLGVEEFNARADAVKKLIALGPDVLPMVEKEKAASEDDEVRMRCEQVINGLKTVPVEGVKTGTVEAVVGDEERLTEKAVEFLGDIHFYIGFSPDGSRVNWEKAVEKASVVVMNGKELTAYQGIDFRRWSGNSERLAYAACEDNRWFMVRDGQEGDRYDRVGPPWFSPDGSDLAYMAVKVGKKMMVVNEVEGKGYDEVSWRAEYVKGKGFAYRAVREKDMLVVVGSEEQKAYEAVGEPTASRDGKHLAYRASQGDKCFMVVDGNEGKGYRDCGSARFSEDGKRIAYAALKDNGKWCLVVDGTETGEYDGVGMTPGSEEFAAFDKNPKFWQRGEFEAEMRTYLFQGSPTKWGARGPVFSPDGKRVACPVMTGGRWTVMCDGKELPGAFDGIGEIAFSPDGKRVAFAGRKGDLTQVSAEGLIGPGYRMWYQGPMWSPDGKHLIWVLKKQHPENTSGDNDWRVVVDGFQGTDHWLVEVPRDYVKTAEKLRFDARNKEGGYLMEADWPASDWKKGMEPIK